MNMVDMIKSQIAGEVGKKLGEMVGASESDMGKILGAGLPSVLSGLGSLASNKNGADKLANAIGGMDSSGFGDLGKMLGSGAMAQGGNILGGLLGGNVLDGIAAAISKFTGVNATMVKMALGYLATMVLGSVGASFKGAKPDGAGISKLFSEQKNNISASLPPGFSLNNVPGFQALAGNVSNAVKTPAAPQQSSGGLGKLLVPGAILAALIGAGLFFFNNQPKNTPAIPKGSIPSPVGGAAVMIENTAAALDGVDVLKTGMSETFEGMFSKLGGITDAASAEAALPALKESVGKMDGFATGMSSLPAEGKSMISTLVKSQLDKLNPIIDKVSAIPGIGDSIKQVLEQLKEKMASMIG